MNIKVFRLYLYVILLLAIVSPALAVTPSKPQPQTARERIADFSKMAAEAGLVYSQPSSFQQAGGYTKGDTGFDYGLTMPGQDFEAWFQVAPLKQTWLSYQRTKPADKAQSINPDSAYLKTGKFKAESVSADGTYFERELRASALIDYNADAGKTYLVDLKDTPETKHYAYALIITLQKNHIGNIMVMCLTNDKGPEFFRNVNRLRSCIRFR